MHPILFTIPGLEFPIRSFGLMLALGFLLGSWMLGKLAARYGDDPKGDPERYSKITVWILVGVVIGARLMYVTVETLQGSEVGQSFIHKPWKIFFVWEGGLVMYGGMLGAIALGMLSAKREGVRAIHALDLGLVAGFSGQAVGRIGCLLVGDDYGRVVPPSLEGLPFPITLRVPNPLPEGSLFGAENAGKVLYATEAWMSLKAILICYIGWQILKHRRYTGQVSLWIILMYAILRSFVEVFRGDTIRGLWFGGAISTSQIVSIFAGAFAIVLLIKNRGRRDPLPDARAQLAEARPRTR
jgi:phosphatidylglycerol---prolipoprotein diacylglyceryl transferase